MLTHMISLANVGYGILTPNVIRGHQRSLEVKKSLILNKAPRDPIFGMNSHMISLTHKGYSNLTLNVKSDFYFGFLATLDSEPTLMCMDATHEFPLSFFIV